MSDPVVRFCSQLTPLFSDTSFLGPSSNALLVILPKKITFSHIIKHCTFSLFSKMLLFSNLYLPFKINFKHKPLIMTSLAFPFKWQNFLSLCFHTLKHLLHTSINSFLKLFSTMHMLLSSFMARTAIYSQPMAQDRDSISIYKI